MSNAADQPKRTAIVSQGRKKIHTTFPDGAEMVEEYDERTDELLLRKVRKKTALGASGKWEFEVGEDVHKFNAGTDLIAESSINPIMIRRDTADTMCWRIRNLPYPADVYDLSIDQSSQEIVVRTSNKKYFKRISVPDLTRNALPLEANALSWCHRNSTLIIEYQKPDELLEIAEKERRERVHSTFSEQGELLASSQRSAPGTSECKQQ